MTEWLVRLFVKDSENTADMRVRQRYGKLGGFVGIIINLFLFSGKIIVGTLAGSVSITADAVNNLSDAGSSIISLVSFKLAGKPADKEHPFGHARIEYVASMIVAFLILLLGVELFKSSVLKIFSPEPVGFNAVMICVLVGSILLKLWLFAFNKKIGKRIRSTVMEATAADSLSDVMATSAVLISAIVSSVIDFQLDGYVGAVVAVLILLSGIGILKDTLGHLLGKPPEQDMVEMISGYIIKYDGVLGIHDLMVHNYGPGRCFACVHVEVSSKEDILKSHDLIDNIEREFRADTGIQMVIHLDPVITDNEQVNELKHFVRELIADIDGGLSMHDFRAVLGPTHSNLIFDVVVPFNFDRSDGEIIQIINERVKERDETLFAVVTIDKDYTACN